MTIIHQNFYLKKFSPFTEEADLPHLISLRRLSSGSADSTFMHAHSLLELFYFYEGVARIETPFKIYDIQPYNLVVLNANTLHRQYSLPEDPPASSFNCYINDVHLAPLASNTISSSPIEIRKFDSNDNFIFSALQKIIDELSDRKIGYIRKANCIFQTLFVDILRLLHNRVLNERTSPEISDFIVDCKIYLDKNYLEYITLEDLSKRFYVSKEYLCKKFSQAYHVSPIQYLMHVRIEQAKILLETTNHPITDIAIMAGISNPAYFSELFKKIMNISPSEYRKFFRTKF